MVARIGVALRCRVLGAAACVSTASVTDVYRPLLDAMPSSAVRRASINGVLVVKAPAGRVQLDELVTHGAGLKN